ncbi:MAG: MotA/TolQ/ExbB proton channel family protein [Flavobacteriales bacterium]|jgi:biopolymer transport protein ExbB|nr:MotA/TolQ/ExbB proton channel family protein [Flavobacteriales bacterium]
MPQDSIQQAQVALTEVPTPVEQEISIIELIQNGGIGGQIIMLILFILSVITVYIYIERFLAIRKEQKRDENFILTFKDFVEDQKIDAAKELCNRNESLVSEVFSEGIKHLDKDREVLENRLEKIANQKVQKMESKLPTLATIAGAAPMLGFLGTVIGMIVVFHKMASAGGQIKIDMLSNGIYTAMTTTVAGLIVGIIAYIAYNNLAAKMNKVAYTLETACDDFSDIPKK